MGNQVDVRFRDDGVLSAGYRGASPELTTLMVGVPEVVASVVVLGMPVRGVLMPASFGDSGDSFRGLILQLRGRIGLTQRELAARLDVHHHSVQAWEAGTSYPGATSLRAFIAAATQAGGFTPGNEATEVAALWAAAVRESPRLRIPFDQIWFNGLLNRAQARAHRASDVETRPTTVTAVRPIQARRHSWGEAPDVAGFVGRAEEQERLRRWVLDDRCRVMGLYGLAGIGKTLLAADLAHDVAPHFEYVYWR